jgi:TolB protein
MTTISFSNARRARVLAAVVVAAASAACSDDQPTAPRVAAPTLPSAQLGGTPKPNCWPKCAPASRILYVKGDTINKIGHIWVMNEDTTGKQQLGAVNADDDYPSWSPDYQKVVFSSKRRAGTYEIFVMNADGTDVTPVTTAVNGSSDEYPSWSPDGSKIFFSRWVPDGYAFHDDIYSVNANGTGLTKITNFRFGGIFTEPSVSPDGKRILVSAILSGNSWGDGHIYSMTTSGTGLTQITNTPVGEGSPRWSPDGTKIVFVSNFGYPDKRDIATINADGTGFKTVMSWPGPEEHPSFSRDGTRIVFTDYTFNRWGWLMTVKTDGTGLTQLQSTNDLGSYYDASWSR